MKKSTLSKLALGLVLASAGGGAFLFAADEAPKHETPTTKPAADAHLVKPWDDIESLSADQKEKIIDIHKKANAEITAIKKKENDDIMALLTDAQKSELKAAQEKDKAEAKAKKADKSDKSEKHKD